MSTLVEGNGRLELQHGYVVLGDAKSVGLEVLVSYDVSDLVQNSTATGSRASHSDLHPFGGIASGAVACGENRVLGNDAATAEVEAQSLQGYLPRVFLDRGLPASDYAALGCKRIDPH